MSNVPAYLGLMGRQWQTVAGIVWLHSEYMTRAVLCISHWFGCCTVYIANCGRADVGTILLPEDPDC